jgi:NADP-dependent 3-hydroxy acid dehydrogenase YdfG
MFNASTLAAMSEAEQQRFVRGLPKARLIQPSEIAESVCFLTTQPEARIFHGAVIDASQGLAVRPGLLTEFNL